MTEKATISVESNIHIEPLLRIVFEQEEVDSGSGALGHFHHQEVI